MVLGFLVRKKQEFLYNSFRLRMVYVLVLRKNEERAFLKHRLGKYKQGRLYENNAEKMPS